MLLNQKLLRSICLSILPKEDLLSKISISCLLVDEQGECILQVGLNELLPRYPASLVKLFWAMQALMELKLDDELMHELELMLIDSSDEAGQKIVEYLTGSDPQGQEYFEEYYLRRLKLENFWTQKGLTDLKLAHKTFLNEYSPFDRWIKLNKSANQVTAQVISKLWQGIWTNVLGLSVSKREIFLKLLRRLPNQLDLKPEEKDFQSSLIGFALPQSISFYGKSGWLNEIINDSVLIPFPDGTVCILTVLCELGETAGIQFIRTFSGQLFENL